MNIVLLGPPGSGKGTQAEVLAHTLRLTHVAMGDLLREHVARGDEVGLRVKDCMARGELVPDEIAFAILRERLQRDDVRDGVVFDGFPRTLRQAKMLDEIVQALGRTVDGTLQLDVPDEELVSRLSGRLVCRECRASFHRTAEPFTVCPHGKCQGECLYRRDDDVPETVRERLEVYHRETEPVIAYYAADGRLAHVHGSGTLAAVSEATLKAARRAAAYRADAKNSR
jgi:adenylate kinase